MVERPAPGSARQTNEGALMDVAIANRIVDFVFERTGHHTIVCDDGGRIVAAKIASRVGNTHAGSQQILRDRLPELIVTAAEEAASEGRVRMGINMPIIHADAWIGTFGIAGDPERTEPIAKTMTGIIAKEVREAEDNSHLLEQAARMRDAIAAIAGEVVRLNATQATLARTIGEVAGILERSAADAGATAQVIETIQAIANQTSMLGLNAAIEAAHAREHGAGFAIVAEAVRKLSDQSARSAESVRVIHERLQVSMAEAIQRSGDTVLVTQQQGEATGAIATMMTDLEDVGDRLLAMARRNEAAQGEA
jgi:hypothetical protein